MTIAVLERTCLIAGLALLVGFISCCAAAEPATSDKPKGFKVFNNMAYADQPDLAPMGLIPSKIIYQQNIWKEGKAGAMPDEQAYKEVVKKKNAAPGTVLVLDIEDSNNYKDFVILVKWTHEAAPGTIVGFYGKGTETKELANAVDAFFPEAYTFSDSREKWKGTLEHEIKQSHKMAPGKPVYPYVWPQYHHGTPKSWQFLSGDYWSYQLHTAREVGADGVVLWGAAELRGKKQAAFKENAPWWQATLEFMEEIKK